MRLAQWLTEFRALHEKAKAGTLPADAQERYDGARDELARAFLAAQSAQARPGQSARRALRVARALQVDLAFGGQERSRAVTLDLSVGGFGVLLGSLPPMGAKASVTLRLPGGDLLNASAKVVGVVPQAGSARVAFAFDGLGAAEQARLESLVFDTVLGQISVPT